MDTAVENDAPEPELDGGPLTGRAGSERTCIVNRRASSPEGLLRFVVGPDGTVVPDLKARLPGRGAWVTATRAALAAAVKRKLFARAFRSEVTVPADLPDLVDRLLEAQALASLSLANKAGAVVAGFSKVEAALSGDEAAGLIHAADASDDGVRKLGQVLRRLYGDEPDTLPRVTAFTSLQLDLALGRMNVIHAALLAGGPSENALARCTALETYRTGDVTGGGSPASVNEPKHRISRTQPPGAGPEPNDR
ncbi:RNA-binding protein [Phreatobacter cathodiphilus]|uniref:RNA-binding protein n=1 Tax=Phreatobacter cathodiphilus TaxID=1868589 RepID=A0A2S0NGQ1_9HYPH|nr:RNA-binding protein [Phreatobacter cathodiphilus]AVO47257.1 RNA-binding protein [Phreatobacter cathodiphilus]